MTADFDRSINQVSGPNFLTDNVYRVNAADRDRGKAGHDQFRDTLHKKKQDRPDDQPDPPVPNEPPAPPAPPPTDRVLLSSAPPAATMPASAPVPTPTPAPVPSPKDSSHDDDQPAGRIHVTA